ncbi:hypothetical protein BU23DRAFT_300993 [Bimuria novae-zelandiae CBS 107.79]|uniref:Uncharacterized protein n=1 Tax=Bimuria novae-zelandiae CBS 107.79 TaxID=1447943 RepID=A0A6A5UPS7_9PLEO|nr:hypothetical protein BU23DRAFT_300993 [Bimuria novae-zelandiae CBS 107.79]
MRAMRDGRAASTRILLLDRTRAAYCFIQPENENIASAALPAKNLPRHMRHPGNALLLVRLTYSVWSITFPKACNAPSSISVESRRPFLCLSQHLVSTHYTPRSVPIFLLPVFGHT